MKIAILSMGYSGYWVACWRELQRRPGVELKIYTPQTKYPYADDFLKGLNVRIFSADEMANDELVRDEVFAAEPDVLVIGGWASHAFVSTVYDNRAKSVVKIMTMDSSWEGSLRQILSRFKIHGLVRRFDAAIVGGARGRKFARWIGFKKNRIYTSIYGYDAEAFDVARTSWPKRFCFVGRYAPVKGLSTLLAAYGAYRQKVGSDAWPLDCYGSGPLKDELAKVEGVVNHGFVQPNDLPHALAQEGVFVFPSLYEPWGVALAEACGSGLPAIVSDKVTSGDDLVEDGVNGYVVKARDSLALCRALCQMHENYDKLPDMGKVSQRKAAFFAPKPWADRWLEAIDDIRR